MPDPIQVRSMFGRIARRYDLLNRLLSAGIDQRWRKRTVAKATELLSSLEGTTVLDSCCGTGDLSLAFADSGARVMGVDFTPEMLDYALVKGEKSGRSVGFARGDAMCLPLEEGRADLSTVAFGIRNVADRILGLREMARVVRPNGWVLVLEFTQPPGAVFSRLYRFYFTRMLPFIGKLVSKDNAAYRYLPDSVLSWPGADQFQREMESVGLADCGFEYLTRGIACLHWGRVVRPNPGTGEGPVRA